MARRFFAGAAVIAAFLLQTPGGSGTAVAATPNGRPEHVQPGGGPHHYMGPDVRSTSPNHQAHPATGSWPAPFMTRPYWGPHAVNAIFDHCSPDYTTTDGKICDVDGNVALSSYGVDPTFPAGYAVAPGSSTYMYYNGHNGWDLNLVYETVLAAADGTIDIAGQDPYNPGFGQTITINHPNGLTTRYAHLSQIYVHSGDYVTHGEAIGVSGNTGSSTGPHLHFGLYITSSWTAIDPWGWNGSWPDPNPDEGDLWLTGNPHDPIPDAPTNVQAVTSGSGSVRVSWTAPAFDGGGAGISSYDIVSSPGGVHHSFNGTQTQELITGLDPRTVYTFTVTAWNSIGGSPASAPSPPVQPLPVAVAYFPWFDKLTPAVTNDNIHLTNPDPTLTSIVAIKGLGTEQDLTLNPGTGALVTYPAGSLGGPITVEVESGAPVVATQRVQFANSFNEIPAVPAGQASTSLYMPWYDLASPGMQSDNIHVLNPSSSQSANLTITGPGAPITLSLPPGAEQWATWPAGTIGGPVHINVTSGPGVIASQRVQYYGTFNESLARPVSAASPDVYFPWFDKASPGMSNDNLHLVNPDATADANVTIFGPGPAQTVTVPHAGQTLVTWAYPTIGGPVHIHVNSGPGVIASQRVQYYNSFNETPAAPAAAAAGDLWFNWFDKASPGMFNDNLHLVNPSPTQDATVTISGPGQTQTVTVPHGGQTLATWPWPVIGGPVHLHVVSGPAVIATQRVQYMQSFNEVGAG